MNPLKHFLKRDTSHNMAINLKDPRKYKFGSVAWQEAMEHNVNEKMAHSEDLGPAERAYIETQSEIHPKEDIEITFKPIRKR